MKAKMFFAVLIAGFLSVGFAGAQTQNEVATKSEKLSELRSQIIKALKNVPFIEEGSVSIYFKVDESKNVSIVKIDGGNAEMIAAVSRKIKGVKFDAPEDFSGNYSLKVNFVDAYSSAAGLVATK